MSLKNCLLLNYTLEKEDIIIETLAAEGFSAVSGKGITVGLTLELNEELIQEGIVRDLVRQVQNIRKDAGFSVEDRIIISWKLDSEFQEAFVKFEDYFCISNFAPKFFIIFKNDGEEVKTVSKLFIFVLAPVNKASTNDDIHIL